MTTETKIDTGTDELLCVIRDRVAVITLNRPEARNAMSDNLTPALRNMIKACGENPDVGVLLLTGAGTAFCAGGNVKGMGANRDKTKLAMSHDERVDAARCEAIGLVNRVVPDDRLQAEAFALAKSIAEGPTIAIRYMKDNLDEALMFDFATARDHEAERMIRAQVTADHREAVQAFIDKRKPVFRGS